MNLKGSIIWVGQVLSGTSQRGSAWQKQDFVLRYNQGQFPNDICLSVFNQEKYIGKLKVGMNVSVDFDCTVRDWTDKNGQLHKQNDLSVWRDGIHSIQVNGQQAAPQGQQQPQQQAPQAQAPAQQAAQPAQQPANNQADQLPF